MNREEEITMLYMHCRHDDKYLSYILDDYIRLRDDKRELEGLAHRALKETRDIMRALWDKQREERNE